MPPKSTRRRAALATVNPKPTTAPSSSTTPPPAITPPQPTNPLAVPPVLLPVGGESLLAASASPTASASTTPTPAPAPPLPAASTGSASPPLLSARCKNPGGEPPKKPRIITSTKTNAMVKSTGKKIDLNWSTFHNGPDTKEVFEGLVKNIGAAVRKHVPMLASSFKKLEEHHRDVIFAYLENFYEINPEDGNMMKFIEDKAGEIFRN